MCLRRALGCGRAGIGLPPYRDCATSKVFAAAEPVEAKARRMTAEAGVRMRPALRSTERRDALARAEAPSAKRSTAPRPPHAAAPPREGDAPDTAPAGTVRRVTTDDGDAPPTATDVFEAHRRLLFSVAYRMLGSVADAEDVLQDSWLRWAGVDQAAVEHPRAYLVRVVSTTALNRLRSAQVRRESYVGPWLPEPLVTGPDVADEAEMAESVSLAMLVVLETLSPDERAVFVLREVFGIPYAEIGEALERTETSVRQLAHRARSHVRARRPRYEADRAKQKAATDRFIKATLDGDVAGLMSILAPDVTLVTDGGGRVTAARNPVHGADKVARFLAGVLHKPWQGADLGSAVFTMRELNGGYALVVSRDARVIATFSADVVDGRIAVVRAVVNPDKLGHLQEG